MSEFEFAISVGWDNSSPTNVEDIISAAPHILPDQRVPSAGAIRQVALDNTIIRNGKRNIQWQWAYMSQADFTTLLSTIWGTSASAAVTIKTIDENNTYQLYNCIAERPVIREHYTLFIGGSIRDLVIPLWDLQLFGGFDEGFDSGFG